MSSILLDLVVGTYLGDHQSHSFCRYEHAMLCWLFTLITLLATVIPRHCRYIKIIGKIFFFLKIIIIIISFSIFMIFNNFHKQHKCNNRLTNNSINNCYFCFLFTPSFLKVFPSVDVMLEPKKNGRHQGSTSQPRAQSTNVYCSRV